MEAIVTIIAATVIAFQAAWITYRLKQQDNARDAARSEMKVQREAADIQLEEIHVLVNTRLTEALERVMKLEEKLGLTSGADIPNVQTITTELDDQGNAIASIPVARPSTKGRKGEK